MFTRRSFVKTAAAASAAAAVIRPITSLALPPDDPYLDRLGLQLWTVRQLMAAEPAKTLAAVKHAGYSQVELMDVMDADVLVPLAREQGLEVTSAFIPWNTIGEENPQNVPTLAMMLDKATKNGLQHLVFGYIGKGARETADQYRGIAQRANAAAQKCRAANIQLCYHNHSFEFKPLGNGQTGYDIFVEQFDPDMMKFEVDVFWVAVGGRDPVELIRKLDGRVSQVHLKDVKPDTPVIYDESEVPADAFQEVGDGTLDMAAIIDASRKAGVVQCHVEQDQTPDPLASIQQSYEFLEQLQVKS